MPSLREQLGCWAHERWRTELVLRNPAVAAQFGLTWLDLCNRNETISRADDGRARVCHWRDTSVLTVCRLFPAIGGRLLQHCLNQWPLAWHETPPFHAEPPDASIIMAFRGAERLPQLRACLASLRGQQGLTVEIILVEQSWEPLLDPSSLPGVRYFHARSATPDMAFNKSWALNVGARQALTDRLIFHDGDILAPADYARTACALLRRGYTGARLPRLVFYLDRETSMTVQSEMMLTETNLAVAEVRANCPAILVMDKSAYWRIGGHDETFYGWGGEDDEILQRAQTLKFYPGNFMPFVHLWHPAQVEKHNGRQEREAFTLKKLAIPVDERIAHLVAQALGDFAGPCEARPQ